MKRALLCVTATGLFALTLVAQPSTTVVAGRDTAADSLKKLPPQAKIEDSKGRQAKNDAPAGDTGRLYINFTGTLTEQPRGSGCFSTDGEITRVTNPGVGTGSVVVDTKGKETDIRLDKTGRSAQDPVVTIIRGGNANVTVRGNNNELTVGGRDNLVTFTGNDNTGKGEDATSQGEVLLDRQGRRNEWNSNGGDWRVRNN